jgi:hypothetical protein
MSPNPQLNPQPRALRGLAPLAPVLGVLLTGACLPLAAGAATVIVPGDFATVQAAVAAVQDDAAPGEVILASDGPFDEQVTIARSVTIRAATGFAPVIQRSANFDVPIRINASTDAATHIVLRGIGVRASGGSKTAISVRNASATQPLAVTVDRAEVEVQIGDHGIRAGSGDGGPVAIDVTRSRFEVVGDGSGNPSCIMTDPPGFPLSLTVADSVLRFSRASGIVVDAGVGAPVVATIDRNVFEGFATESGSGRTGIDVGGVNASGDIRAEVSATNNLFLGNATALDINGQGQNDLAVFFANNTALGAVYSLVTAQTFGQSTARVDLFNNVLIGAEEAGISTFQADGTTLAVDADHNLLFANAADYDGVAAGPNDVHADPLFVDAAADDFRLAAASPAVDAGTNAPPGGALPALDLDRKTRVFDGDGDGLAIVDIGAFEVPEPSAAAAGCAAFTALAALRRGRRAREAA